MRFAIISLALSAASVASALTTGAADACAARSDDTTVPLVEFYTSEGCSSCPPADRWLSQRIGIDHANFLAFHVDYWDDLGWPDRFGSARYSDRQRARVRAAGSSTVYTPQVMVGTNVRARWHDRSAWSATLQNSRKPAQVALAMRLQPGEGGWNLRVGAAFSGGRGGGARLWLARHADDQATQVRAGENRGATLHHDRVVLALEGPWPLTGAAFSKQLELPAETAPWGVTAFVQDARGETLQSLDLSATACAQAAAAR